MATSSSSSRETLSMATSSSSRRSKSKKQIVDKPSWKCVRTGKVFESFEKFLEELSRLEMFSRKPSWVTCSLCNRCFETAPALAAHRMHKHPHAKVEPRSIMEKDWTKCYQLLMFYNGRLHVEVQELKQKLSECKTDELLQGLRRLSVFYLQEQEHDCEFDNIIADLKGTEISESWQLTEEEWKSYCMLLMRDNREMKLLAKVLRLMDSNSDHTIGSTYVSTESCGSNVTDSPVLSLVNKQLQNLHKKFNHILQMEESLAHGKLLSKEQFGLFMSKPAICVLIDQLVKLSQPLTSAVSEERSLALQHHASSANMATCQDQDREKTFEEKEFRAHEELPKSMLEGMMPGYEGVIVDRRKGKVFESLEKLSEEVSRLDRVSGNRRLVTCSLCKEYFGSARALESHRVQRHYHSQVKLRSMMEEDWRKCYQFLMFYNGRLHEEVQVLEQKLSECKTAQLLQGLRRLSMFYVQEEDLDFAFNYEEQIKTILADLKGTEISDSWRLTEVEWKSSCMGLMRDNREMKLLAKVLRLIELNSDHNIGSTRIISDLSTERSGPSSDVAGTSLVGSPVLNLINKRIRNLRKKLKRILQMEESLAQGKLLNKEQFELFISKPTISVLIEQLVELSQPLTSAVSEERSFALQYHASLANKATFQDQDQEKTSEEKEFIAHKELPIDSKSDDNEWSAQSSRPSQVDQQNEGISLPLRKELNGMKINWKRRCHNYFAENERLLERVRKQEQELEEYCFSNVSHLKFCVLKRWYSLQKNDDPDPDPDPLVDLEDDKDLIFDLSIREGKEAGITDIKKLDEVDWEAAYKKLKKRNLLLKMEMEAFQNELNAQAAIARELPAFSKRHRQL